jgi:hypothetical protein
VDHGGGGLRCATLGQCVRPQLDAIPTGPMTARARQSSHRRNVARLSRNSVRGTCRIQAAS